MLLAMLVRELLNHTDLVANSRNRNGFLKVQPCGFLECEELPS